jgi:hypothetical protein
MCLEGAFNGAGDTWTPTRLNFFCLWLGQVPVAWLLAQPMGLGPLGVFIAVPLAFSALALWSAVLFIGLGTAGVFLLRCRSLQSLPPATVGAYHNLIPICTIAIAHWYLGEPLTGPTVIGALAVLLGTELVRRKPQWTNLLPVVFKKGIADRAVSLVEWRQPIRVPPLGARSGMVVNNFAPLRRDTFGYRQHVDSPHDE